MSKASFEERRDALFQLSDQLFGRAEELSLAEAETLLRATDIEPDEVVRKVRERMVAKVRSYELTKRPVPILLQRAVEELRPTGNLEIKEGVLYREARRVVRRLLDQVEHLRSDLAVDTPTFSAAYRKKQELTERDKRLLGAVADDLRKRLKREAKES